MNVLTTTEGATGSIIVVPAANVGPVNAQLADGAALSGPEFNAGNSGTFKDLSLKNGSVQRMLLTGPCLVSLDDFPDTAVVWFQLKLTQDATGSRTIAFSYRSGVFFAAGFALSTAANAVDILTIYLDGTNGWCSFLGKGYA